MQKKKKISNIQEHHTLAEYQRYFSHLLRNGKLKRYPINQKNKLDPNRQYWKIEDEKGETFYYELPKYIKPESTKSAYSLSRVMHRRPARVAIAIFGLTAIFSITSAVIAKKVFVIHYPDVPPADLNELQTKLHNYQEWAKEHPGEDVSKSDFTISDLANTAIASAIYDSNSYSEETGYLRRPFLAVGFGNTKTEVPLITTVYVEIANAFIYQNGDALEESISFSSSMLAPKVGRRDFYTSSDQMVNSNPGDATSQTEIVWKDSYDRSYQEEVYKQKVGKNPDSPFLYTINESTVLEESTINKIDDGYKIDIKLDKKEGVANYIKRIMYLSGKSAGDFVKVDLSLITDNNMLLKSFSVDEEYYVESMLRTSGQLTTKYYYEDVPSIPARKDSFDYSKYKA